MKEPSNCEIAASRLFEGALFNGVVDDKRRPPGCIHDMDSNLIFFNEFKSEVKGPKKNDRMICEWGESYLMANCCDSMR